MVIKLIRCILLTALSVTTYTLLAMVEAQNKLTTTIKTIATSNTSPNDLAYAAKDRLIDKETYNDRTKHAIVELYFRLNTPEKRQALQAAFPSQMRTDEEKALSFFIQHYDDLIHHKKSGASENMLKFIGASKKGDAHWLALSHGQKDLVKALLQNIAPFEKALFLVYKYNLQPAIRYNGSERDSVSTVLWHMIEKNVLDESTLLEALRQSDRWYREGQARMPWEIDYDLSLYIDDNARLTAINQLRHVVPEEGWIPRKYQIAAGITAALLGSGLCYGLYHMATTSEDDMSSGGGPL